MSNFFEQRLSESSQASRLSVGGKIRVGTKAISKKTMEVANSNPKVGAIIARVREGKMSFREAEKELYKAANMSNPFYPRNTREFHAHAWDMGIGGISTSRKILDMYGEKLEGDKELKLYKFPVVFPEVGRSAASIIDGGMAVQGGGPNTVRYWSGYDATGVRVCMHLPEVQKPEQAQRRGRSVRHPERKPITRGACEPGECFEFQNGMCRFNGTVRFYLPGIAGAGVFELHTGSTQAATDIYLRLTEALRVMGGRLQNYTPDGKPVFWLTKKLTTRKYFENGEAKVGEQWVPMLDMEIEMPAVLWLAQQAATVNSLPQSMETPDAWLDGGSKESLAGPVELQHQVETFDEDGVIEQPASEENPETKEVQAMLAHAEAKGYGGLLENWIQLKYQGFAEGATSVWGAVFHRMGDRVEDYIDLAVLLLQHKMDPELTTKYLKIRFGPMGNGELIADMKKHLEDLLSDGVSVAVSVMEETIDQQEH